MQKRVASGPGRTKHWLVRFPRAVPIAIFLLIAAITALSVYSIERGEDQRSSAQLRNRINTIASAVERRASSSSSYLRAGAALLASMDEVRVSRFRRFVSELRLDADYQGAEGIGWAQIVEPEQVEEFERQISEEMRVPMTLRPPIGSQPYAAPVTILQPDTVRNRRALGFDMLSEPVRREAMLEAARTGRPTASGRVVLMQEGEASGPGFLIYMPVFEAAPNGRRLKGFIYSPFNAEDFLVSALELEQAGNFNVRIYDQQVSPDTLLAAVESVEAGAGKLYRDQISVANQGWVLEVETAETDTLTVLSMVTLIFGMLVASLLMLIVRMLTRQAMEDTAAVQWLEDQVSIRNSLTRELNHRVKNTLANVLSIIALTRRRAESLDEFADGLDGRIRALSATHDLLTQSDWGTTPIRSVIEAELAPYTAAGHHHIDLEGPAVDLAPNDALSLGLAIHELATNAAKYGALSEAGGRVKVEWTLSSPRLVRLHWEERGGPPVTGPKNRGFGTDLIEKIVARELKSPVELRFDPEGVTCTLTVPVREPTEFAIRAAARALAADKPEAEQAGD